MVTPLKNIVFPKILGSRGVWILPSRNRVEAGFAAMPYLPNLPQVTLTNLLSLLDCFHLQFHCLTVKRKVITIAFHLHFHFSVTVTLAPTKEFFLENNPFVKHLLKLW